MPIRRPNLLDAFRQARDLSAPPAGGAASGPGTAVPQPAARPVVAPRVVARPPEVRPLGVAPAEASVAQPVPETVARSVPTPVAAAPSSAVPSAAPRAAVGPTPPRTTAPAAAPPAAPRRERVVLLGLAITIATLALVAILRSGSGEAGEMVSAAPPATAPTPPRANPEASPANPSRTPDDNKLYDARNRYTVRLIQYPNDARGLGLATETYRWLVKNGYPVGSPILLANGRGIVLCADAKPADVDLFPLRDNLRALRYPSDSKTRPFSDAFVDKIDNVLAR